MAVAAAALLAGLPVSDILARYRHEKGNEIGTEKFASLESSAALAANAFGFFLNRPDDMPPLPGWNGNWRPTCVIPEAEVRFPWRGGLHPWLDALIETDEHLVGVESKRYEPFRTRFARLPRQCFYAPPPSSDQFAVPITQRVKAAFGPVYPNFR